MAFSNASGDSKVVSVWLNKAKERLQNSTSRRGNLYMNGNLTKSKKPLPG
jgi:hypothetical protein